jgi:Fe-S cluster assembly protein SufD
MIITKQKYEKPGKYEEVITFNEKGEERQWIGIVDAREKGEYTLHVVGHHTTEQTRGRVTIHGVVGAGATLTVTGMIKIEKQAQHTDDFLEIRILLLDKTAHATAEPKLEIEADDVKASHAASVGKIDEEQVLYLMSRGLDKARAEEEIVRGFLDQSDPPLL